MHLSGLLRWRAGRRGDHGCEARKKDPSVDHSIT